MAKQKKQLVILVIVLAAVIAAYFLARHAAQISEDEEQARTYTAVEFNADDIVSISGIGTEGGYSIDKIGDSWYIVSTGAQADSTAVQSILDDLAKIEGDDEITLGENEDQSKYGLDRPQVVVEVKDSSGTTT